MQPFGFSYLLDMYDCRQGACDDLELHYRFLEKLVHDLGMIPMTVPYVVHAPVEFKSRVLLDTGSALSGNDLITERIERYPDKAGVSGWIALVTSGIQIHSCEPKRFSTIDVYSCNKFEKDIIKEICKQALGFTECEDHWVERGTKYHA